MPRGEASKPRVTLRVMLPWNIPTTVCLAVGSRLLGEGVRLKRALLPVELRECGYFSSRATCRG